jgi:hypothetical protein
MLGNMRISKPFIALALALAGLSAASLVFAWHHRGPRVSIGFGFGYPYPYHYPPPYYYPPYYPAPVVIERAPPVYVEQNPPAAPALQAPASSYWYFCAESNAYYPYVKECASGWQRVAPRPG